MTQEEKIKEILDRHFGHHVVEGSDEWYTRNYQNRFSDLQEMADWMKKHLIEKAVKWLSDRISINQKVECNEDGVPYAESYLNCCEKRLNVIDELISDFKKAMEER